MLGVTAFANVRESPIKKLYAEDDLFVGVIVHYRRFRIFTLLFSPPRCKSACEERIKGILASTTD